MACEINVLYERILMKYSVVGGYIHKISNNVELLDKNKELIKRFRFIDSRLNWVRGVIDSISKGKEITIHVTTLSQIRFIEKHTSDGLAYIPAVIISKGILKDRLVNLFRVLLFCEYNLDDIIKIYRLEDGVRYLERINYSR